MSWAFRLWLAVAVAISIRTLLHPESHTIYPVLAGGAAHWWSGEPLYADYKPLDYFRYPPAFAVAFTPFYALGPRLGGVLWSWLGAGVFVAGLRRFVRDVIPERWTAPREAVFLALGALGALRGLWNAQSNALAVGLLLLGAAALVRRRWWPAAAWLAASVLLKLTPLAPVLLLCALQPRRLPIRFGLCLSLGLFLPFLTRPPLEVLDHYREWFAQMAQLGGERWPGFRDGWTVWLVIRHWAGGRAGLPPLHEPLHSVAYRAVQLLTAAAALGWCVAQGRRPGDARRQTTLVLAMGVAWLLLFGPATEFATYVFLAPVLHWALLRDGTGAAGRCLLGTAFVLVNGLGWGAVGRAWTDAAPMLLTALPAATTLFTLWIIAYARPDGRAGRPDGGADFTPVAAPVPD